MVPTTKTRPDSLVIVPTYNEARSLESLVYAVLDTDALSSFSMLVIDDNSPDGTGDLADFLATERPDRLAVLHRPRKLGLGSAYVEGFRHALNHEFSYIFEMDADFSHDPSQLPVLRSTLEISDVVLGSRYVPGGNASGSPAWRRALSRVGSRYAGSVLGLPFRDLTGGFKGFRARVLKSLDLAAIKSSGYAFQIEVTYRAYVDGFRILEVPISFGPRIAGRSKMYPNIILEALLVVWWLRFNSNQSIQNLRLQPPVD